MKRVVSGAVKWGGVALGAAMACIYWLSLMIGADHWLEYRGIFVDNAGPGDMVMVTGNRTIHRVSPNVISFSVIRNAATGIIVCTSEDWAAPYTYQPPDDPERNQYYGPVTLADWTYGDCVTADLPEGIYRMTTEWKGDGLWGLWQWHITLTSNDFEVTK